MNVKQALVLIFASIAAVCSQENGPETADVAMKTTATGRTIAIVEARGGSASATRHRRLCDVSNDDPSSSQSKRVNCRSVAQNLRGAQNSSGSDKGGSLKGKGAQGSTAHGSKSRGSGKGRGRTGKGKNGRDNDRSERVSEWEKIIIDEIYGEAYVDTGFSFSYYYGGGKGAKATKVKARKSGHKEMKVTKSGKGGNADKVPSSEGSAKKSRTGGATERSWEW